MKLSVLQLYEVFTNWRFSLSIVYHCIQGTPPRNFVFLSTQHFLSQSLINFLIQIGIKFLKIYFSVFSSILIEYSVKHCPTFYTIVKKQIIHFAKSIYLFYIYFIFYFFNHF